MKNVISLLGAAVAMGLAAQDITLVEPVRTGGATLMQALSTRKSAREYSPRELSPEVLSSLLWAADGVNRADGRRTAPTGLNVQDIDVYVMLSTGVYLYDARKHALKLVNAGDHRAVAGRQDYPRIAPVNLFYVQNLDKAMKADSANTARHGGIHTGAIMQNVYLFCAQEKLSCVARDYIDRDAVAKVLKLSDRQRIILSQTVGHPPSAR